MALTSSGGALVITAAKAQATVSNTAPGVGQTSGAGEGQVGFFTYQTGTTDPYFSTSSATARQWLNDHWQRSVAFRTWFDNKTSWYPQAWSYINTYGMASDTGYVAANPSQVLKANSDNTTKLYLNFGCSGGVCPLYAMDPGNSDWVAYQVSRAVANYAAGYRGMFMDDVNLDTVNRFSNGTTLTAARDPRTGAAMTLDNWCKYMAQLLEAIRAAIPNAEIVHNALFWSDYSNQYVKRQAAACDYYCLERGWNDTNMDATALLGQLDFVDTIYEDYGTRAVYLADAEATTLQTATFGLACSLLASKGQEMHGTGYQWTPDNWNTMYDTDFGDALGPRYQTGATTWQRDFTTGTVTANLSARTGTIIPDPPTPPTGIYVRGERVSSAVSTPGTSRTFSIAGTSLASSRLVLLCAGRDTSTSGIGVSDTRGNTWTIDVGPYNAANDLLFIASTGQNAGPLGFGDSVTVTFGTAPDCISVLVEEIANLPTNAPDAKANPPNNAVTLVSSGSTGVTAVTTQADEIVIACANIGLASPVVTPGSGWTSFATPQLHCTGNGLDKTLWLNYKVVSATGTQSESFSWSGGTSGYQAGIITYK